MAVAPVRDGHDGLDLLAKASSPASAAPSVGTRRPGFQVEVVGNGCVAVTWQSAFMSVGPGLGYRRHDPRLLRLSWPCQDVIDGHSFISAGSLDTISFAGGLEVPKMVSAQRWLVAAQRSSVLETFQVDLDAVGDREIVVETLYSAISSGTEKAIYSAADADVYSSDGWCRYPCRMGYSGVGRIITKGRSVVEFNIADRVLGMLGHESHRVLNVDEMMGRAWSNRPVMAARVDISDQAAAFVRIAGIAMTPIQLLRPESYSVVGIWGLGIVGNLVAQLLRSAGHKIVGVDPDPFRRNVAESVGIEVVLDPEDTDFGQHLADLAPDGFRAIVDTVGDPTVTVSLPTHLGMRGQLVLMTHWRSESKINGSALVREIFRKGLSVHGGLEYGPGSARWQSWSLLQYEKWRKVEELISRGMLNIERLVSVVARPEDHVYIYDGLDRGTSNTLGILIDWRRA